jgi:hypothetical protein
MFTTMLPVKAKCWELTKMPTNNRMDKMWYIHAIDERFTNACNNMDPQNNAEPNMKSTQYMISFILDENRQN